MGNETTENVSISLNLLDEKATKEAISYHVANHGEIDILISNAGTGKLPQKALTSDERKSYFLDKNFITARNLIEASIPHMNRISSSIVGISSIVALKDIPGAPTEYAESKRLLNKYFKEMAIMHAGKRIRFNVISPGNLQFPGSRWSEIQEENPEFVKELLQDRVPLGSFISPEEIAAAVLFLSSNSGRNITGANLVIDGGQSI
jgi:NAD(P)-dependent dehydrogenase (short-subunit alcohol dehydrogenase family)